MVYSYLRQTTGAVASDGSNATSESPHAEAISALITKVITYLNMR